MLLLNDFIAQFVQSEKDLCDRRCDRRYTLNRRVAIRRVRTRNEVKSTQPALALNISLGGIGLITTRPCEAGQYLAVTVEMSNRQTLILTGLVVYSHEAIPGVWHLGLSFDFDA